MPFCLSASAAKQKIFDTSCVSWGIVICTVSEVLCWALGWMSDVGSRTCILDVFHLDLVLLMPARGRFMCPLEVAGDLAKCFRTSLLFINGIFSNWWFWTACRIVSIAGLRKHWCMYFSWFCLCGMVYTLKAEWVIGWVGLTCKSRGWSVVLLVGFAIGLIGSLHKFDLVSRSPTSTSSLLY